MQHMTIEAPQMTFEDVCRAARVAESLGQQPLTLQEQATLYAIKVHAYHSLSSLVHKALAMLDALAGDADIEANGDEQDYSVAGWNRARLGGDNEDAEDDDPREEEHEGLNGDEGDYSGYYGE